MSFKADFCDFASRKSLQRSAKSGPDGRSELLADGVTQNKNTHTCTQMESLAALAQLSLLARPSRYPGQNFRPKKI